MNQLSLKLPEYMYPNGNAGRKSVVSSSMMHKSALYCVFVSDDMSLEMNGWRRIRARYWLTNHTLNFVGARGKRHTSRSLGGALPKATNTATITKL